MSWYKDEIPKEYKRLEYIQSTGTQYIDTGTPLTSNSRIVMDCELTTVSGTQCFFCSRTEATTTDATSNTLFAIGSTYRKEYYGESKTATNSDGANKRIVVDNNKNSIKIGNVNLAFSSVDEITSPMNCYLMASTILENGVISTFSNFAYMKLYSCQIYDNDVLLRNFVPCQRKSDSVLGLFDIVEQVFYVNSGTGAFAFKQLAIQPKAYIGVKKQIPNYIEQERNLTVDTFSDFFDSTQSTYKWEVKSMGQVLNNVLIEPTGSYGTDSLTETNNYFEVVPKIDFKGLNIFLSYITETNRDKVYFSYNGTVKIDGVSGTSSQNVIVNLTDVKAGDKLKIWYIKDGSVSATNEKVQFQLVTIETPKIKVEDGTYHIKELSEEVNKLYLPFNNIAKTVLKGYIGINNLSKLCFSTGIQLGSLPIGSTIEVPVVTDWQGRFGQSIVFKIADKNHNGYPDNCTTLITDKIIQLMAFDAAESSMLHGNSDYISCNLLQWLNSDAIAGEWYSPRDSYDKPPSNLYVTAYPYESYAGFLAMLDSNFIIKILKTAIFTSNTKELRMFLASPSEVNGGELKTFTLFKKDSTTKIAYPSIACAETAGYVNQAFGKESAWLWWLGEESSSFTRIVDTGGKVVTDKYSPYEGIIGLRPVCNLSNNVLISKEPNVNGHYTLL